MAVFLCFEKQKLMVISCRLVIASDPPMAGPCPPLAGSVAISFFSSLDGRRRGGG